MQQRDVQRTFVSDHWCCFVGLPRLVCLMAEEELLRQRARPADMTAAVTAALTEALCGHPVPAGAAAAGRAIADAVVAHAISFLPGNEPPYHDQRHQAEATVAMGWLCARAVRQGLLDAEMATAGVLAMAGHDLQHDGTWRPAGVLEAHSAGVSATLGTQAGLNPAIVATMHRVILATDPLRPRAAHDADDLLCRLAQEADIFASLLPELGWQLSHALAREADAAGHRFDPPVASFTGRLALFRRQRPLTPAARDLGVHEVVADQLAAMAACGDGSAGRGAAWLDALPLAQARADFARALAATTAERPALRTRRSIDEPLAASPPPALPTNPGLS